VEYKQGKCRNATRKQVLHTPANCSRDTGAPDASTHSQLRGTSRAQIGAAPHAAPYLHQHPAQPVSARCKIAQNQPRSNHASGYQPCMIEALQASQGQLHHRQLRFTPGIYTPSQIGCNAHTCGSQAGLHNRSAVKSCNRSQKVAKAFQLATCTRCGGVAIC
jgi:hypothetical protein